MRVDVLIVCSDGNRGDGCVSPGVFEQSNVDLRVLVAGHSARCPATHAPENVSLETVPAAESTAASLNRLLDRSDADVVVVPTADALLLPGALDAIVTRLVAAPDVGVVAAPGFRLGPDGSASRERVHGATSAHRRRLDRYAPLTYLSAFGECVFGLYVFRRNALRAVAGFDARAENGVRSDAALRVAAGHAAEIHPELACALRSRPLAARLAGEAGLARWHSARRGKAGVRALADAVSQSLGADDLADELAARFRNVRGWIGWRIIVPLTERTYAFVLRNFASWPIGARPPVGRRGRERRIAYYLWRYPVASETFIRRELAAIKRAGIDVRVIADGAHYGETVHNEDDQAVPVRYLLPVAPQLVRSNVVGFLTRKPLTTLNLLVYVVCRTYGSTKSLHEDVHVFSKAVRLAAVLREERIAHVHAPWGDTNAFIAMVASRLAGIPFSLQLRAHDIHRRTSAYLLDEKVRNAEFAVTNTRYNRDYLAAMLPETESAKVRQIYNGLDIRTFVANGLRVKASEPVRILSVARLIEPKGLVYLLEACDRLRARGYRFRCVIIGGPERPLYVNDYLEIRRTHERLALDGCVDLLGALPFAAVRAQYARADLFALPCVRGRDGSKDIIPNAILEAMAAGLPVVATRLTAIPELVDDGVTGLLVEPRDIDALAGAMARLIDDAALRAEMGRNGRTRAERLFDIEHNVRSYVEMFEQP